MRLLTVKEVSEILRVPESRTYDLIRQHIIPHVHLGRQIRVDEGELQEFIKNGGRPLPGGWRREA